MTTKVLKFSASWCQPCQMLSKRLEGVDLGAPLEEIDIDENRDLAVSYGIRSVPTIIILKEGEQVARLVGVQSVDAIRKYIT